MIYELKQKIRYSKWGDATAKWLEKTPVFPACYWLLAAVGWTEPPRYVGANKKGTLAYFRGNQDKINKITQNLADEKSKKVFKKAISCRCSGYFRLKGTPEDQYFPQDIIHLSDEEVFVDCGAYTGDTIAKFREQTKDHYKKIVAFEPDPENFKKLIQVKVPNCICFQEGVWNKKETLSFWAEGDMGSSLVMGNSKKVVVSVQALDGVDSCSDMTFLKMDIEGAELNALKGAEQTIRKQRPKLAICIYHSNQDMLEIPLWVMSLNLGYKLYVRHHDRGHLADTILYAV